MGASVTETRLSCPELSHGDDTLVGADTLLYYTPNKCPFYINREEWNLLVVER